MTKTEPLTISYLINYYIIWVVFEQKTKFGPVGKNRIRLTLDNTFFKKQMFNCLSQSHYAKPIIHFTCNEKYKL